MQNKHSRSPQFLIVGAMKCATTSLYDQLKSLPGIFMPQLKEPNFFSDDDIYELGTGWYQNLFSGAEPNDICGEASTHYTKFPTYPDTVTRITDILGAPKLIYVIRHPIERLISQYIHEWSQGVISEPINTALDTNPELIEYSRYAMQLSHYAESIGRENILVVQFEHIKQIPDTVLQTVCDFIGYGKEKDNKPIQWQRDIAPSNVSSQRVKRFPLDEFILNNGLLKYLRRNLIPQQLRNRVKRGLTMQNRPALSDQNIIKLTDIFNRDLAELEPYLGKALTCETYHQSSGENRDKSSDGSSIDDKKIEKAFDRQIKTAGAPS